MDQKTLLRILFVSFMIAFIGLFCLELWHYHDDLITPFFQSLSNFARLLFINAVIAAVFGFSVTVAIVLLYWIGTAFLMVIYCSVAFVLFVWNAFRPKRIKTSKLT